MSMRRRIAFQLIALPLIALGLGLMIRAGLGVGAYDVLTTGLSHFLAIPIAIGVVLVGVGLILIGLLLGGRPGVGTVVNVLVVGPILGLMLPAIPTAVGLPWQTVEFALGAPIQICGVALLVASDLGPGAAEVMMLGIVRRGPPVAPVRSGIDVAMFLTGLVLGGSWGVGTLVYAASIGPQLALYLRLLGWHRAEPVAPAAVAAA